MREQSPKITFVSPLSYEVSVAGGKRTMSPYFYLLQPGASPLKLEYATKVEAKTARTQLLASSGAHPVSPMKTFWAIHESFTQIVEA